MCVSVSVSVCVLMQSVSNGLFCSAVEDICQKIAEVSVPALSLRTVRGSQVVPDPSPDSVSIAVILVGLWYHCAFSLYILVECSD